MPNIIREFEAKIEVSDPYKGEIREVREVRQTVLNSSREATLEVLGVIVSPSLPSPGIREVKVEIEGIAENGD